MNADTALVPVRVNIAAMRQPFHPCTPNFIASTCQARCCRSTTDPTGIAVVVTTAEAVRLRHRGADVDHTSGRIAPVARRCPFQGQQDHLCSLHGTDDKPAGCVISPFTVNANGTLIVRNRYRRLPCFKADGAVPVVAAHRASLIRLIGTDATDFLTAAITNPILERGAAGYITAYAHVDDIDMLRHKDINSKAMA